MVPAYILLVALPLVACGMDNNQDQMKLAQMMMQAMNQQGWGQQQGWGNNMQQGWGNNMQQGWGNNMQQGWGNQQQGNGNQGGSQQPNFSMENKEEYEAYLKWCAESRARQAEQAKQQELLDAWKARQEESKHENEKHKHEVEEHEREQNMQAQWKMWEQKMKMAQNFDSVHYEVMELKHKYYYTVTFEFLKFCKCSDFAGEIQKFFHHEGVPEKYEDFDLADLGLTAAAAQDPFQVAQALNNLSQMDQIKSFFGGLAASMCEGARAYYNQVHEWEEQHHFLERLV